ncbi:MAG TPA: transposase [Myxococcaceae bacterium]|nr:transposase [Myxococcaceae bacterium]
MAKRKGGSRQRQLIPFSMRPTIPIDENHRLVVLAEEIDWTDLLGVVETIRLSKVKSAAGRPPHLRALVGALLLRATRRQTYRETEDLIRYYAPARYLCGLTETDWTPDHNTLFDFETLLGEEGVRQINEYAVKWAVAEKLADPSVAVGDTTAQEAAVPYPNEMGLMAAFVASVGAASKRGSRALQEFAKDAVEHFDAARKAVREYRLFAKTKTKRLAVMATMMEAVGRVQRLLARAIATANQQRVRLTRSRKVAQARVLELYQTMKKLLPQIAYWHRTGYVAKNKIISVHIPELYSIVRGKIAKPVEFGLSWGITRLRGGYLLAKLATHRHELHDKRFAVRSVDDCIALFGTAPTAYAYDRGGHSEDNVATMKKKGVRHVGLAPQGNAPWAVSERMRNVLVRERALIEAGIGTIKNARYGFNRPPVRSARAMGMCGQRAVLGFNLNKLARELAARKEVVLVG